MYGKTKRGHSYYVCTPKKGWLPEGHPPSTYWVREDQLVDGVTNFLATQVFGEYRRSLLGRSLQTLNRQAQDEREQKVKALTRSIKEIDSKSKRLIRTLEVADDIDQGFIRDLNERRPNSERSARTWNSNSPRYAVWPGQYRSDLFIIDDLDEYAKAFGIVHDERHTGLADHEHQVRWNISPYESNPHGSYVSVEVRFDCGCEIKDLAAFAKQMREQKGWAVATSTGFSGGWSQDDGHRFTVRVRRSSLNT